MKNSSFGSLIFLLLSFIFCSSDIYAGTATISKPAMTYIYGGGTTNSSSYFQSGGEKLTNGTICIYRFFLPPSVVGSQTIGSIQVWIYGKATGGAGGLTTFWIGTDPNDHSALVGLSQGLYLVGNYTGSSAQNLVSPAGDGIGSILDLTLEVNGSGKEYDLNYVQVSCTYSNVDSTVLTSFLDAYAGYRTMSNYASWYSTHWALTNYAQSSFQDGIRWGFSQIPDWQDIAAEFVDYMPYTAYVELQSFGDLSQIANLLTGPIDAAEFQPAFAQDFYSLWHQSFDPSAMADKCNTAATNLMDLASAWTNAFNGTLSTNQQSAIGQSVNDASNSVFSVLKLFNQTATSLSDVYLKTSPGSGNEEAQVLFNVLSPLMRYDYSTNVPIYQTPPLDTNSFLPKILRAIAGQTIPYYLAESNGLAAYYPLDGNAVDASGNGHNGTVFGSPVVVNGIIGSALQFNTVNDYVAVSNLVLRDTNQRSFTLWVKPSSSPLKVMDFLSKHNNGTDCAVLIRTQSDGKYDAEWTIGGQFYDLASGIPGQGSSTGLVTPTYSTFDFLALVYDGSEISFYVNGNRIKQMAAVGNIATNANPLLMGRYLDNLSENFIGALDEVRIYDRPLSALEIQQQFLQAAFTYTNSNGSIVITGYTGQGGAVTIPNLINGLSVTGIGDGAFEFNTNITSIVIPNSVTSIGSVAFYLCNLTNVVIPNSVVNIGISAFLESGLLSVTIPNSVTNIGADAFAGCQLKSITIPDSVINIGDGAFAGCNLTNVTFGVNVGSIGDFSFEGCPLASVTIPGNLTNIGEGAFAGSSSLGPITVDINNPSYRSVAGALFNKSQTMLIQYPSGNNTTSYKIPGTVTSIGDYAVESCNNLESVFIPSTVTYIGNDAFAFCTGLKSIYFQSDAPTLGSDSLLFDNATIYYLPGTRGWSSTFGGAAAVLWNPQAQTSDGGFGVRSNRFGFNITGTANIPIVIQSATNLNGATWMPLLVGTLTNGSMYFSDSAWTNYSARFYRISPQ